MSYVIVTDSAANLTDEMISAYGVEILPLTYTVDGEEQLSYIKGKATDAQPFYESMRRGAKVGTSCLNEQTIYEFIQPLLQSGKDVLYLVFSSGLSATYQNACAAVRRLSSDYPARKVICVDTLCASMGQGLLVHYCVKAKNEGKSIDEVAAYASELIQRVNHIFTVDDLIYLKRGGRIGSGTAIIGSLLKIKPIMAADEHGKLVAKAKVIGRKAAIKALFNKFMEKTDDKSQTVFISHGDCIDDVNILISLLRGAGVTDICVNYIDQVIGAHSGPGTIAIFFLASDRNF